MVLRQSQRLTSVKTCDVPHHDMFTVLVPSNYVRQKNPTASASRTYGIRPTPSENCRRMRIRPHGCPLTVDLSINRQEGVFQPKIIL